MLIIVTFFWVCLFGQEPGQLLRKQWLSARRKEAERKESVFCGLLFFLPRGKVFEEPGNVQGLSSECCD